MKPPTPGTNGHAVVVLSAYLGILVVIMSVAWGMLVIVTA